MSSKILPSFAPWIVFAVCARVGGVGPTAAALFATGTAVGLVVRSHRRGRSSLLEVGAVVWFTALALAPVAVPAWDWVSVHARSVSALGVPALALVSLATVPFTRPFAASEVHQQQECSLSFRRVNLLATAGWGACFLAVAVCHLVVGPSSAPLPTTLANWIVPGALVWACASLIDRLWRREIDELLLAAGPDPFDLDSFT